MTNTDPIEFLRSKRLRWFGPVQRRESSHPSRAALETNEGKREMGRPKKYWMEVITDDMKRRNLTADLTMDRLEWKKRTGPTPHTG